MNGSWDAYLASPADFAFANDIINNLVEERKPGIEIVERTPWSLIITTNSNGNAFVWDQVRKLFLTPWVFVYTTTHFSNPCSLH